MKIKCPSFYQDEIVEAELIEAPSQTSRDETNTVVEITGRFIQLKPPGDHFIIVSASPEEMTGLKNAGYSCKIA